MNKKILFLLLSIFLPPFSFGIKASAQYSWVDPVGADMCRNALQSINNYKKRSGTNESTTNVDIEAKFPVKGVPIGIDTSVSTTDRQIWDNLDKSSKVWQNLGCENLFTKSADVAIARITSQQAIKIQELINSGQLDLKKLDVEIEQIRASTENRKTDADVKKTEITSNADVTKTIIGVGGQALTGIFTTAAANSTNETQISTEKIRSATAIELAKIQAEVQLRAAELAARQAELQAQREALALKAQEKTFEMILQEKGLQISASSLSKGCPKAVTFSYKGQKTCVKPNGIYPAGASIEL